MSSRFFLLADAKHLGKNINHGAKLSTGMPDPSVPTFLNKIVPNYHVKFLPKSTYIT